MLGTSLPLDLLGRAPGDTQVGDQREIRRVDILWYLQGLAESCAGELAP